MPGDSDGRVLANAARQAELQARHRDLTKPLPPIGTDGDSLRSVKGFEGVTDAMLDERANFKLADHMRGIKPTAVVRQAQVIDIQHMTIEELQGLADATMSELEQRMKEKVA